MTRLAPVLATAFLLTTPGAGAELASAPAPRSGSGARSDASPTSDKADRLQQHRNLGKAFYENPATQYDAVPEFEAALALAPDSARERLNLGLALLRAGETEKGVAQLLRAQEQDPSIPHTWFNLGIAYKKAGDYEKAVRQLEGMLERVPDEPITHYNLGVLYRLEGEPERAVDHFERAAELDPNLAGPHFQLATAYRQAGRAEDAAAAMERFRELKARDAGAAVQEDLEWSWYAEIYDPVEPEPRPAPAAEVRFEARELATGFDAETAGLLVLEADGEPAPDLLAWSKNGMRLFPGGSEAAEAGLDALKDVRHAAAGDFDGDGLHDL
ncbi:MAG TPA: tetratricopeptide repeat protein, partial [Thermoanaerobaculia bacterium]|nr:tetratricopeptide repeat protein [Thermoanaerobaculia bacterium]